MSNEPLIKVEHVSKKFCRDLKKSLWYGVHDIASEFLGRSRPEDHLRDGEFWVLRDVSFELHSGESLGLVGRNGAGKSTLLKLLNGLIKPDAGTITVRGRMGALLELGAGFNPILTGRENIYVNAAVLGIGKREVDRVLDDIVAFAEISEFIDMPVQNYSSGMRVRLGFAIAAQMEPDILLVDEVLAVGDIVFQAKCLERLNELRRRGVATILVSHNLPQIFYFCDRGLFIDHGKLVTNGTVEQAIQVYQERNRLTAEPETADGSIMRETIYGQQIMLGEYIAQVFVSLHDAQGSELEQVTSGSAGVIAFNVLLHRPLPDISLSLVFYSEDGTRMAGINSKVDDLPQMDDVTSIQGNVRLPCLPFHSGQYCLVFQVLTRNLTIFRNVVVDFRVVAHAVLEDRSPVALPHQWDIVQSPVA